MNFKDFKGKTNDALEKMITDLRKFGIQNAKNCRAEHMSTGVGEVVCHLIDELLNIELFRREYQFGMPKFPQDDEALEEDKNDDNLDGT
jgi:hypothetical protein